MKSRLIFCLLFAFTLAHTSLYAQEAKPDSYTDLQTGLKFPSTIERLKFVSKADYGDVQLGVGIRYRSPEGLRIDAIIYNLGLKTIAADPADPRVKEQVEEALSGIKLAAEKGLLKDLKVISNEVVPIAKGDAAPKAHKVLLSFTLAEEARESALYLFVYKDHFIKVRATWFPEEKKASREDVAAFLTWLSAEMKK
ncbi:hypothetical protein [Anatilimnocola floriformis]|uniref:hypothetical protein n=1 Tax=Anatilimnocola floriformis TaxID=2948575 RepID=UPI0020C49CEA|nr:hypothetical protein [Anatilimnocola floriformis]